MTEHVYRFDFQQLEIRITAIVRSLAGGGELTSTTCLLGQQGILDSVTTVELVAELEQEFGIDMVDEDLTMENLSNIAQIAILLRDKLSGGDKAENIGSH
ncbi:acyl carrier protein [Paenibacillaceae bacterium WGS1546]|uniref:acyl carrier protein n=1 Tax=Cohnella sp. WGS1546 TaxID=3366810 RepID=UPI00372D535A